MSSEEIYTPRTNGMVAYFDFDGTLTNRDTLIPFVLYVAGIFKFIKRFHLITMVVFLYYAKIFNNERAKECFLTIMLKGLSEDYIEKKAKSFAYDKLDKCVKSDIFAKLAYHLEHQHKVILVSANLAIYLRYWANKHKLSAVIATEIEFINHIATGKLSTRNCYGKIKIDRIRNYLNNNQLSFVYSYGYGNSHGDFALLSYVDEGYWVSGLSMINWEEYRGSRQKV
ncbi:MAG: HAD-IB family hydrolase [Burkholderiales bacterium]|nr:HAD-IB family hydrolase [Burkholderiales bacterium]